MRSQGARGGQRVTCPEVMWSVLRYRKDTWQWMKDGLEQSPGPDLGLGWHDNGNGVGPLEDTVW